MFRIVLIPVAQPCLLLSYGSFYSHVSALRQVRFSVSIAWAWNIETDISKALSLTNKFGKHA